MQRLAIISVHGCPYVQAGEKDAGGMNIYVLETAKRLAARGLQVDVFTRRHDPKDEQVTQLAPGARVVHLDAGPASPAKEGVYDLLPEFCQRLSAFTSEEGIRYDAVSSHYWLSGLVGLHLQRVWGVPHVTSFHTMAEIKRRARPGEKDVPQRADREREVATVSDMVVAWTTHEKEAIVNYYGAAADNVAIIPPGVDTNRFRPMDQAECRRKLGIGDERVLLYVGRLERLKGVDILLKAMQQLEHPSGLKLLILGGNMGSPEMTRLKGIARDLDIEKKVQFLGSVPHTDLPVYYNAADVCVLPSYYESFGLAALEAAACGKPVVASRVGGLPSVVLDGRTGYLIAWRCPGPFVERLDLLLTNDRMRRGMGAAAREHAQTLTWDATADRLLDAFNSAVARAVASGMYRHPVAPEEPCLTSIG
ncbi:MAG: glycosyltransferase family 1 protein [Dehalococcoidia bacterium]|nr:glycosyltransferase family 1 protein [Dehalococcoidia bacterium]MSQ34936.1 glycosyltransferase family 1 protein [Dehalococcoidia bacterium]